MNTLVLVNLRHAYPSDTPQDLIPVREDCPQILLEREAAMALSILMEKLDGWKYIVPVSGWRSMREQTEIYTDSLAENGQAFTEKYVALPGHSEHQTGLAIDLGLRGSSIDFIRPSFPYEGICQRFRELAPAHGFIERYPKGKENITGIAHEPWHFRYVGLPHAEIISGFGLTLEEYLARSFEGQGPLPQKAMI